MGETGVLTIFTPYPIHPGTTIWSLTQDFLGEGELGGCRWAYGVYIQKKVLSSSTEPLPTNTHPSGVSLLVRKGWCLGSAGSFASWDHHLRDSASTQSPVPFCRMLGDTLSLMMLIFSFRSC